jgi:hypothetical protein
MNIRKLRPARNKRYSFTRTFVNCGRKKIYNDDPGRRRADCQRLRDLQPLRLVGERNVLAAKPVPEEMVLLLWMHQMQRSGERGSKESSLNRKDQ